MGALCGAARRAVLEADPRLVEALYLCQVQAAAEALSGVYAVLGRRRARILQVGSVCVWEGGVGVSVLVVGLHQSKIAYCRCGCVGAGDVCVCGCVGGGAV